MSFDFYKKIIQMRKKWFFFFTGSANSSVSASPAINRRQGSPEKAVKHAHQKDSGLGKILFNVESLQFMVAQIFFQFPWYSLNILEFFTFPLNYLKTQSDKIPQISLPHEP